MSEGDHGTRSFLDCPVDQIERMRRALAKAHERDVGSFPRGHTTHVLDVDLACDHLMTQSDHYRGDEGQTILPLVGDQDTEMLGIDVMHVTGCYCGGWLRLKLRRQSMYRLNHSAGSSVKVRMASRRNARRTGRRPSSPSRLLCASVAPTARPQRSAT
jgi:hypothetical protein